jgi:hypothetical protein
MKNKPFFVFENRGLLDAKSCAVYIFPCTELVKMGFDCVQPETVTGIKFITANQKIKWNCLML